MTKPADSPGDAGPSARIDDLREAAIGILALGATGMLFIPLVGWLARGTLGSEQLTTPAVILVIAAVILVTERRHRMRLRLVLSRWCLSFLAATMTLAGLAIAVQHPLPMVPAFACYVASVAFFLFGDGPRRPVLVLVGAFSVYVLLVLAIAPLDYPLRILAANNAGLLLSLLGDTVQLQLVSTDGPPILLLASDDRAFRVAAECNGFGIISGGVLLALMIVLYRPLPLFHKALLVVAVGFAAFFSNLLRIVLIIKLAPHVEHYMLMHEAVGIVVFYGTLALIWLGCSRYRREPAEGKRPEL